MSRYIDADKIEEVIKDDVPFEYFMASGYGDAMINRLELAKFLNDKIPTADVKEVKHGQWSWYRISEDYIYIKFACSQCHYTNQYATEFCPNCGAQMDEEVVKE